MARVVLASLAIGLAARVAHGAPDLPHEVVASDPEANAELIVGTGKGLEAWRRDGSGKRLVSKGVARSPRWLDDESVIVLRPAQEGDLSRGARLERITLADGKRTRLARLPPFACVPGAETGAETADAGAGAAPDAVALDLQEADDFVVDASKRFACLRLLDRNENMADLTLYVRIDLQSGTSKRWFDRGDRKCTLPRGVVPGAPDDDAQCSPRANANDRPVATASFPFQFDEGRVFEEHAGARTPKLRLRDYVVEQPSPSGRWVVLGGDMEDGDYIHRRLVLFDRASGNLFPLREKSSPWPAPLQAARKTHPPRIRTPVENTASVVGETDVRWLGRTSASEVLIIGGLLVRPGVFARDLHGEVAR